MSKAGSAIVFFALLAATPVKAYDETAAMVYDAVLNQYVESSDMAKLSGEALKGLSQIDRSYQIADDNERVSIYYKGRMLRSFFKPTENDPQKWGAFASQMVNYATKISPVIKLKDFEATDTMMSAMVRQLDGESKYFSAADLAEDKSQHLLNFAERREGKILYLKLRSFNKATVDNLRESLQKNTDAEALILDLRGNSGGLLDMAVETAGLFLDEGIIFSTKSRSGENDQFYTVESGGNYYDKPMVILVDSETASSAEALSGSLQEQGRALVVGAMTYGKGSVQKLIELPNGSELALTVAYLFLPSGDVIRGKGVKPDFCLAGYDDSFSGKQILENKGADVCQKEVRDGRNLDIEVAEELLKSKI